MDKQFLKIIDNIKRSRKEHGGAIGVYRFTLENPDGSKEIKIYHNVLTIDFFTMIMDNLTNPTPTNDMLFSHALLGSSATAVSENDHKLGTETYRNAIASKTKVANVAYVTAFFTQAEVSGTFKESGIVSDGSDWAGGAGKDTGILASHVNIDVTKTLAQKLTIDWALTLVNA